MTRSVRLAAHWLILGFSLLALSSPVPAVTLYVSTGDANAEGGGRIYRIDTDAQTATLVTDTGLSKVGGIEFTPGGDLIVVDGGAIGPSTLYRIELSSGERTLIGSFQQCDVEAPAGSLCVDDGVDALRFDASGVLYGGGWRNDIQRGVLITINPATAQILTAVTLSGSTNAFAAGLAFDSTGTLYGSRGNSSGRAEDLMTINLASGVETAIGIRSGSQISDVWFDSDGTLYAISPTGELFTIDPGTGAKTLLFNTGITKLAGLTGEGNFAETLEPATQTKKPCEPVWVSATFENKSGADLVTFKPDCINTTFTIKKNGVILDGYHPRRMYAYPLKDVFTIAKDSTFSVTCDISQIVPCSVFNEGTYEVQATFAQNTIDPDIVDGVCTVEPCVNFTPLAVSSPPQTVIIQGDAVQKKTAQVVFTPSIWRPEWASNATTAPSISAMISSGEAFGNFDSILLNGSVPPTGAAEVGSDGKTLTVTFNGAAAVSSLGTGVRGTRAFPLVQVHVPSTPEKLFVATGVVNFVGIDVAIDIKPGTFPNSINLGSQGTVPVAILGSATFLASRVNPLSVTLSGAGAKLKGNGTPMASLQDVNGDGFPDLVVHVSTQALALTFGDAAATLEGLTVDGIAISGSDTVRIVQ